MHLSAPRPVHISVMPREVLHSLQLSPGLSVLDGTAGAGGHSSLIMKRIGAAGHLIAIDRDPMMLTFASQRLKNDYPDHSNYHLLRGSYVQAAELLASVGCPTVDRVLLDLGLSSDQLADRERGFGFDAGGPLDMRFNPADSPSAADLLSSLSETQLVRIFEEYGEEPAARKIAAEIVHRRLTGRAVVTAEHLENCVHVVTGSTRTTTGRNPATRVFQALRIATNHELQHVEQMMTSVLSQILNPGGIAVILTFHSLEDRIVKTAFKGQQGWQVLTKSPVEATPAEIRLNPRSRSTRLRAVQKL